jgi:hypothetical protein
MLSVLSSPFFGYYDFVCRITLFFALDSVLLLSENMIVIEDGSFATEFC